MAGTAGIARTGFASATGRPVDLPSCWRVTGRQRVDGRRDAVASLSRLFGTGSVPVGARSQRAKGPAWAAKNLAVRLPVLRPELFRAEKVSIARSGDAVKELPAPTPGAGSVEAVLDRVALTLDELSCPEGAELDSPGQRPGTKADAAQHKAQRAVTPGRRESRPVGPLGPHHTHPVPQACGLGYRVWPLWGRGAGGVPPNATPAHRQPGTRKSLGLRPAQSRGQRNKNATTKSPLLSKSSPRF